MKYRLFSKSLVLVITLLFVGTSVVPIINSKMIETNGVNNDSLYQTPNSIINESVLDLQYIYNITENLSNIVFTEYDESAGEIAKGRAFGTKGEWRAAEILYENMTELGLFTTKEQLKNLPSCPTVTHKIEILEYGMAISDGTNTEKVDCHITQTPLGPHGNPFQKNCNFSYKGLKIRREHPKLWEDKEDYVLIYEPESRRDRFFNFLDFPSFKLTIKIVENILRDIKERFRYPHYKGRIHIDFKNNDTYDMPASETVIPRLYINRSIGEKINNNIEDYTVDFHLKQRFNKSVMSYNVIGQLNGTDPSKTAIVGCLYDGWWCQATADSAIGMAIVLGIAKYFVDHNITPKYNIKFVGFAGEEYGMRGSIYYEAFHRDENIIYVIDLNQLGFDQVEQKRLTLQVAANNKKFLENIWAVAERSDYVKRMGDTTDIDDVWMPLGHISDDHSFALKRPLRCKTVCFLKNGPWLLHHRDGLNHTEGDVMKYFNWTDVSVTGEIILNVTKCLTVDPDDQFTSWEFTKVDIDNDGNDDSIQTAFNVSTDFSEDYVTVKAQLCKDRIRSILIAQSQISFVAYKGSNNTGSLIVTVPKNAKPGWYYLKLLLVDSSGEVDHIKTSPLIYLY